jgi:hypothetical protein
MSDIMRVEHGSWGRWVVASWLVVPSAACGGASAGRDSSGETDSAGGTDADTEGSADGATGEDPGQFGPEDEYELRLNLDEPPPLLLQMNRGEVAELFGDSADEVLLLELDSTPLLEATMAQISSACGNSWQLDNPNPQHDCSLTPLGQSFAGPDGTWQTSDEYAMVRLLTMTPANVVVEGTTSSGLQGLADFLSNLGIIDDYSQILSDALGIPRTEPVVSTQSLVASFQDHFVATHPNVPPEATLSFTLGDALTDLASLSDRFGPMDGHPGIIDPSFTPYGEVFGPEFMMVAEATSNLRLVDGIDADMGKGFMSVVYDTVGPTYEDELEFDFEDPAKFSLQGIVEDLTVDLRFRLREYGQFVPSCTGASCQGNLPGSPASNSSVWARDPWDLEYVLTAGAYNDYGNRVYAAGYLLGTADVNIGQDGNPPGWVQYDILFGLGNPPEDQYIWETVLEVGQVALHNTPFNTFSEGQTDVAFTLHDVPVGITGSQAAEAVRPYLQAQAAKLSDFLLGDYEKNNDRVDFFYARGDDGNVYLYFIAPGDRADDDTYTYADPGFFSDSALAHKISETAVPGLTDTVHEKVRLDPGETVVYFGDESGQVYRLRITLPQNGDGSTAQAAVAALLD